MKEYLIVTIVTITIFSLLESLLIKGSLNKLVKSIFSLICVLIIAYPTLNLIKGENLNTNISFNEEFTAHLLKIEENTTKLEVQNLLNKNQITAKNVEIMLNNSDGAITVTKIIVTIQSKVINENGEHIIIADQVKKLLEKNAYTCEIEVVIEN